MLSISFKSATRLSFASKFAKKDAVSSKIFKFKSTTAAPTPPLKTLTAETVSNVKNLSKLSLTRNQLLTGGLIGALAAQSFYGSGSDYFEHRFIVNKDPDDLAGFYGGEEFMELYTIFPIVGTLLMRGGEFDDRGVVHTYGLPGEMLVYMAFTDGENEETGDVEWFNKRERFKDVCFGYTMWDQVTNFGFHTLPDGRVECYHHGEYFVGNLPLLSLAMKIIFQVQSRWVAWATDHYLNHHAFTAETEEEEEIEELCRANHPKYLLKYHFWKDFKAMLGFGITEESKKDISYLSLDLPEGDMPDIPTKRSDVQLQVRKSIAMDNLANVSDPNTSGNMEGKNALQMAQTAALVRHQTLRVERRNTVRAQRLKTLQVMRQDIKSGEADEIRVH